MVVNTAYAYSSGIEPTVGRDEASCWCITTIAELRSSGPADCLRLSPPSVDTDELGCRAGDERGNKGLVADASKGEILLSMSPSSPAMPRSKTDTPDAPPAPLG